MVVIVAFCGGFVGFGDRQHYQETEQSAGLGKGDGLLLSAQGNSPP
jgi:hypothetical protein